MAEAPTSSVAPDGGDFCLHPMATPIPAANAHHLLRSIVQCGTEIDKTKERNQFGPIA